MIGDRALLALVGGAVAVGMIWWSPSLGAASPETEVTSGSAWSIDEEVAPRALAAALITHLGDVQVESVDVSKDSAMAIVRAVDGASYLVMLTAQTSIEPHCQGHSLVCRTLDDGTVVTLRKGRSDSHPELTGWAYRPDGASLLLEVFNHSGTPYVGTALAILEDDELGSHPSPQTVAAGNALDVGDLQMLLTITEAQPGRSGGELLSAEK